MDKNEQVARKLGLTECDGHQPKWGEIHYCWITPGSKPHSFEFQPPDYVSDIKVALTLVSETETVVILRQHGRWCATWGPSGNGDTLSAAIVDAFLAAEGGKSDD